MKTEFLQNNAQKMLEPRNHSRIRRFLCSRRASRIRKRFAFGNQTSAIFQNMTGNPYGMFSKSLSSSFSQTAMTSSMMAMHIFLGMRIPLPAVIISSREGLPA